jgi:hypothetical protein
VELHPQRRQGHMAGQLARRVRCFEVGLSRDPNDLRDILRRVSIKPAKLMAGAKVA